MKSYLMMMGREGGAAGEYYTPRPLVRLMVKIVNPKIGETVFDPHYVVHADS
jgi:type I restriction enzyme M protein